MVISLSTIYDIAKRAGVSPATVSRALNNQNLVKEETRKKIHKIAEEMNYSPNFLARSLVKKQTNTIALIISDITNPFFTTVARGVEDKMCIRDSGKPSCVLTFLLLFLDWPPVEYLLF